MSSQVTQFLQRFESKYEIKNPSLENEHSSPFPFNVAVFSKLAGDYPFLFEKDISHRQLLELLDSPTRNYIIHMEPKVFVFDESWSKILQENLWESASDHYADQEFITWEDVQIAFTNMLLSAYEFDHKAVQLRHIQNLTYLGPRIRQHLGFVKFLLTEYANILKPEPFAHMIEKVVDVSSRGFFHILFEWCIGGEPPQMFPLFRPCCIINQPSFLIVAKTTKETYDQQYIKQMKDWETLLHFWAKLTMANPDGVAFVVRFPCDKNPHLTLHKLDQLFRECEADIKAFPRKERRTMHCNYSQGERRISQISNNQMEIKLFEGCVDPDYKPDDTGHIDEYVFVRSEERDLLWYLVRSLFDQKKQAKLTFLQGLVLNKS